MIQKVSLIFASFFLFSCSGGGKANIPNTVLSKQKMAEVMLDIHLLEAAMNITGNKATIGNPAPTFDVLKKYKISKKQYDESFDYYSKHPELLSEVYQLVLTDLSKMQAIVMNKK